MAEERGDFTGLGRTLSGAPVRGGGSADARKAVVRNVGTGSARRAADVCLGIPGCRRVGYRRQSGWRALVSIVEQFSSDRDKMITKVGNLANQISNAIN